jgi:nitrite reductase/ring-hydroxylating ferredoxin subunit
MANEQIGRRGMLVGAGCAALAMLGGCSIVSTRKPEATRSPQIGDVLVSTAEVPVGGGVLVPGSVLVLQLTEGDFTAFSATCPHQYFLVRPPDSDGIMTCTGHQSKFRAVDGARVDGPATHDLTPIKVKVSGTEVVRA